MPRLNPPTRSLPRSAIPNSASSDSATHEALAEAWIQILKLDTWQGRPYNDAFAAALAASEDALKADPKSVNAYIKRSRA